MKVNLEEEINVEEVVEVEVIDINVEVVKVKICIGKDAHHHCRLSIWLSVGCSLPLPEIYRSQPSPSLRFETLTFLNRDRGRT